MKDGHVKDAAQGVAGGVPPDVAQDLAFGARAARALLATPSVAQDLAFGDRAARALLATPPPPPPPSLCSSR